MKTTVVRYKLKPERVEENVAYVRKVFEQLVRESPPGLRYCSIQLEDKVSFVHVSAVDDSLPSNPLTSLAAFKEFTARIADRCEEPPKAMSGGFVGAYRTFGA